LAAPPLSLQDSVDVDGALLKLYGIAEGEERSAELKPKRCPRCSMPLDLKVAVSLDLLREEADRAVARFIEEVGKLNPEVAKEAAKVSGIAKSGPSSSATPPSEAVILMGFGRYLRMMQSNPRQ
jgi:hypothetical protein